ncbi:hypothetical protein M406DRAFT_346810 [Cryphonectria parasitica EP155]|uniref:Nephrocystin 3-like N-terminal domain-containing protein n=1 Tax=Cryphonectria parasitica (strain ATCC 38755 / EP155) TaxID=660469 RepID=A0A9P4Y2I0_CRYP1|nr:uncharacterized protein M406DRAFT_346810 [Cryphonectria parasitica EP155]KAF3764985.1 hypothetical protein M406DRAFT_346810 [Cryphonectria parasitica EP155]
MTTNGASQQNLDSPTNASTTKAAPANAAAVRRSSSNYQALLSPQLQTSPSFVQTPRSSTGRWGTRRGPGISSPNYSFNGKSPMSVSRRNSYFASGDVRCQHEIGVGLELQDRSYSDLLDWIEEERLIRLPQRGGCWDRVLIYAQHFADQVCGLGEAIESFVPGSSAASDFVFGQCLFLLYELGYENAVALDKAFTLFYNIGLVFRPLLRKDGTLLESPEVMHDVSRAFSEMLSVVADVAMAYYGPIRSLRHGRQTSITIDIYARFGHRLESFRTRVHHCADAIWQNALERSMDEPDQVHKLQSWLAPQDTILKLLTSEHVNLVSRAEEYTCTWLQPHLNSFFEGDDKCLLVQGNAGFGKTTLANWVVDRLQRPVARKDISTLSFFFNSSVMALETPLAMLKTLLLQLLTQRVGDVDIFRVVMEAYTDSSSESAQKQEEILWNALEAALENAHNDETETLLAIIVDLDELEAQKARGKQVAERLQKLAHKTTGIRLLLFSSPFEMKYATATTKVNMTLENTSDDVQTIIRHGLTRVPHFSDNRDEAAQEQLVDQLMSASDGSILYAFLVVRFLKLQKSLAAFGQAVEALAKSPHKTVTDVVQKLLPVLQLNDDSKALLSLLVAAERPLSRKEIELLLQVQIHPGHKSEGQVNIDSVIRSVAPFAMTGEGLVTLRHRAIKHALVSIPDSSPQSLRLKERHRDFLLRLFACAKNRIASGDGYEPTLAFLSQEYVDSRLASDRILEYTVRYWPVHFRKSPSLYKQQGDLQLPKDFSSSFPSSVGLALLEAGCWRVQSSLDTQIMDMVTLAYRVRRAIFGQDHPSVLQSAIICAIFCEHTLSRPADAIEWYFKASTIGRVILGVQSELVIACCTATIRLSESFLSKTRTEIMTYREQTLILLVSAYKQRYGEASEEVLEVYNTLVELYISISEEQKAAEIRVKIEEIMTLAAHTHGEHHHSSRGSKLLVTIKRKDQAVMISIAVTLLAEKKYARYEELLLELWLKLDEYCRGSQNHEWHQKKIEVTLKYVEVLHIQKRREEASALLLSCWNEYSCHTVTTFESIILCLKEVGHWMQRVQMTSVALAVFQKCWSWYKSSHKETTTTFKQIEEQIAITSKEIVKVSSTTSTTSVTESSETVLREVFESSLSSKEVTEVYSSTIELCESLSSLYFKEERWSEASSILKQTLMRSSFSSLFSQSLERIDVKSSTTTKNISLVMKLAECYIHQSRFEKAEHLYLSLYRLHRKSCDRLDDALIIKYTEVYIEFLKKHAMVNQLISFYQDLLVEYRGFYGRNHARTISVLYALGDLCHAHPVTHGYFVDYYLEIVTNLNQGALVCHEDALRALVIVSDHYYQSQRFSESLRFFRSIIATFCKLGTSCAFFKEATVVQQILEKYYKAIEETEVEISEHLEILKEIRQACLQYFGESSSISVFVTLHLAEVYQRSEKYQYEAISYYEHILKHSKTVSKTVVERSQSTLRSLYVKQVTSSTESKTVTKETLEKATEMSYSQYLEIKKVHSVTHHATLTQLKELVMLYKRQSKTTTALTEMRSLVVECLSKTTSSQELIETAKYVAEMYVSCGYASHAHVLVHELKLQLIYKIASKSCGFDITRVDIHGCFAFVATLEWSLRSDLTLTIASFMTELLAESLFYERFSASIKAKDQMHVVLMRAARLQNMLSRLHRHKDFDLIETSLVDYFVSVETRIAKSCSKNAVRAFLVVLLARFSAHPGELTQDTMTSRAGRAAVDELRSLLQKDKFREAIELARATYLFLMAHEGLDDPTEISLGFQICQLMAGHDDQGLQKEMLSLAAQTLGEVLEICKTHGIDLVRCQWTEINNLISLLGELNDLPRLQWLLNTLWQSRDGQYEWGHDVMLALGLRLVQVSFTSAKTDADRKNAIRLAEDLAYNVRRVHGARHQRTLEIMSLLASLYTSTAQHYHHQAAPPSSSGAEPSGSAGAGADSRKRAADMAKLYFKKAAVVHEDLLKLLVDSEAGAHEDASDSDSVTSSSTTTAVRRRVSSRRASRVSSPVLLRKASSHAALRHSHRPSPASITREQEVQAVKTHLRLLKMALQRFGSWAGPAGEYERLTTRVWRAYSAELSAVGVKEEQVLSTRWKLDGFGQGKAEGRVEEGAFAEPRDWRVCV